MLESPIDAPTPTEQNPAAQERGASQERNATFNTAVHSIKRNRFRAGIVLGALVTVGIVLVIVQNGESTQLDWIAFHFKTPLWILLTLTAAAGAIVWELIKVGWRRGRRQRRDQEAALTAARESLE